MSLSSRPERGAEYSEPIAQGRVRTICCEGLCSNAYRLDADVAQLKSAGWSPMEVRGEISHRLRATNHVEWRRLVNVESRTVVTFYKCLGCGHERAYGVEEL